MIAAPGLSIGVSAMSPNPVFISHASRDDVFVKQLRDALEGHDIAVWVDSRKLRGGALLLPEINAAIEQARQVIVVLSPHTVNSPWVRKEISKALAVEQQRKDEGYRVIPLLLPGIEPSALELWFDEEPVGVRVKVEAGGLSEAMPAILAALGEGLPDDAQQIIETVQQPVEELILKLSDPKIRVFDGKRRAAATATLVYEPADPSARQVESKRFTFTAPLGVIEGEDLRWYLEEYYLWPIGMFKERAERIEAQLPGWGQDLYEAALALPVVQETFAVWQRADTRGERRFSVFVDPELPDGTGKEDQATAREAASELLSLPWELLHDGRGFLFHGKHPVRVRRRLPNRHAQAVRPTRLPIRILLVSPRPEEENRIGYIDHRISARPLIEAVESLGELAIVSVLAPPTFSALEDALHRAGECGEPFDVVHFDGHGIYDREHGLGALCFEDPNDAQQVDKRRMQLIHAEKLAEVIRDHRIPLVFLEACQTAKTEEDPTASVAAKLLEEGVASVIAMSHSVLVETAHRFVKAFYHELAQGKRVGSAMIAGQRALHGDTARGKVMGAGELHLQDWFVPVLYQEEQDSQLITKLAPATVQQLQEKQRRLRLGALPDPPAHAFQGRSRELLALERLLGDQSYAVIRGQGGAGKTTLAVELARWLVRSNRFRRAAFVSLEQYSDARSVLDSLGHQLLPEGESYSVAQYADLKQALQPVERALNDRATIIVLDNLESVLPDATGQLPPGAEPVEELWNLCRKLLDANPATRIVFTSREPLPAPFDHKRCDRPLGALSRQDAIALVGEVMKQEGLIPKSDDPGSDPQEIIDLVETVNRHARALVLLAREVARKGVRATTENLRQLMGELDQQHHGDRENSLYASVELSLRRLPPDVREQIKPLAVFHGGAHLIVFGQMLGADEKSVTRIATQLIEVGLAEDMGYHHLRLDPALPPYLLREMSATEQKETRARWVEAMQQLTRFLYQQRFQNVKLAAQLTRLEMPNLMAMLMWMTDWARPEAVVDIVTCVERLFANLDRPQALAQASRVREQAESKLGEWSYARFLAEINRIDRLIESGNLQSAYEAIKHLLEQSLAAGEQAYPEAAYNIADAHITLGKVLKIGGAAENALMPLSEAERRFQILAEAGNTEARRMASIAISETAECLVNLGRWDEAEARYKEAIRRNEKHNYQRGLAVDKFQLGNLSLQRGQYAQALRIYIEALGIFESLGEPGGMASAWHQIGIAHRQAEQFEQAERAYRQSLAIKVRQKDLRGEGSSLAELGNLYDEMGRLEEAVKCHRQAADLYVKLQAQMYEGDVRNNLAVTFIKLQRYNEARRELHRAIQCGEPYGHAARRWTTWNNLHHLERVSGNVQAAIEARQQAIESYLAYRRAGGQSRNPGAQLGTMTAQAIAQGDTTEIDQVLTQISGENVPLWAKAMVPKLQAIVRGERDPKLADDPNLEYDDAAELLLLLEILNSQGGSAQTPAQ
jgi:tetratricopeptide (TPR) repeat protein